MRGIDAGKVQLALGKIPIENFFIAALRRSDTLAHVPERGASGMKVDCWHVFS
jgi:hypothetical protein